MGEGGWASGGLLYLILGLFGLANEYKKCQPQAQTCLEGLRDLLLTLGSISDPCLPCSALHGSYCLSREITWSAKLALEKQTS